MAIMKAQTSGCAHYGHPEFRVLFDESLLADGDVRFLLDELESPVAAGRRYTNGDTFQLGWMELEVKDAGDGTLALFEPDMIHTPIHWVESVTHSLIHRRLHQEVCASVTGMEEPAFPSHLHSARICVHLGTSDGFFMNRSAAGDGESGWVLACSAAHAGLSDQKDFLSVSLYEAAVGYEPRVLPYLALAEGVSVGFSDNVPVVSMAGRRIPFNPGSSLEERFG